MAVVHLADNRILKLTCPIIFKDPLDRQVALAKGEPIHRTGERSFILYKSGEVGFRASLSSNVLHAGQVNSKSLFLMR